MPDTVQGTFLFQISQILQGQSLVFNSGKVTEAQNNSDWNNRGQYFLEPKICKGEQLSCCCDSASQNPTRWVAFPPVFLVPWRCGRFSSRVQDGRSSISYAVWVPGRRKKEGRQRCLSDVFRKFLARSLMVFTSHSSHVKCKRVSGL